MKELIMKKLSIPVIPEFNYEEIKKAVDEKVQVYSNIAYTEEEIKDAKADRAEINKLKKALDDKRKEVKKAFTEPLSVFEAQIKELTTALDSTARLIDSQVTEVENRQKEEKRKKINEFIQTAYEGLGTTPDFDERWLNKSVSFKSIKDEIVNSVEKLKNDIATLNNSFAGSQFLYEGLNILKETKDLAKAIEQINKLTVQEQKKQEFLRKQEEEQKTVQTIPEPVVQPTQAPQPTTNEPIAIPKSSSTRTWRTIQVQASNVEMQEIIAFLEAKTIPFQMPVVN